MIAPSSLTRFAFTTSCRTCSFPPALRNAFAKAGKQCIASFLKLPTSVLLAHPLLNMFKPLILWDHGGGWTGVGPDDTDGEDILTLPEIRSGIAEGLAEVGLDSVDLLGFDACLMATFEVATQVQDLADVMVASEDVVHAGLAEQARQQPLHVCSPVTDRPRGLRHHTGERGSRRLTTRRPVASGASGGRGSPAIE